MSEFVYLFRGTESQQREFIGTPERAQQSMQLWLTWMRGLEEKGHLKSPGQPLGPPGKVVRGQQKTVTDGPYLEAKDLVAGFIVVEARDLAQAAELAKGCPMLEGGGSVEVRPVNEMVLGLNRKLDPERAARWRGPPQ
ncbi:MAG TPA: YciI family protein [Myxococcales bacterium]|nr:YciI family protein [Myxococcales bacterium]